MQQTNHLATVAVIITFTAGATILLLSTYFIMDTAASQIFKNRTDKSTADEWTSNSVSVYVLIELLESVVEIRTLRYHSTVWRMEPVCLATYTLPSFRLFIRQVFDAENM